MIQGNQYDDSTPHRLCVGCSMGVLLMNIRSCGLGTNLPSVDTIILYDSDWNPR